MLMGTNKPPVVKDLPGQEQAPVDDGGGDQQLFEDMVAGITEFMFGKGKSDIANQLAAAKDNLAQTIGQIAFTLVSSAVEQVKQAGQEESLEMDMVFGVAAETIDSLIRMVQALDLDAPPEDQLREQAMMAAVQSYLQTAQPGSEEQAAAQQMLAQMHGEGDTQAAAQELQGMGQRAGVDPFGGGDNEMQEPAGPEEAEPPAGAGLMGG